MKQGETPAVFSEPCMICGKYHDRSETLVFTTSLECHVEEDVWNKLSDMCKSFVERRSRTQKLLLCQAFAVELCCLRKGVATPACRTSCYRLAESCSDQISLKIVADPSLQSSFVP